MNIIIVGNGVSGLMCCTELRKLHYVKNITLIGSSKIPTIGVGESTTGMFSDFVRKHFNINDFVKNSDAAVKYGVYYKNWSKKDFIHAFQSQKTFLRYGTNKKSHGELLSKKPKDKHIHDYVNKNLWQFINENKVSLDLHEYVFSWHFNAAKFINFLKEDNSKSPKVKMIDDKITQVIFDKEKEIKYIKSDSGNRYQADYYINATGENDNVFEDEYYELSNYLLTNRAAFYPLPYENKRKQFHPYTVAKTMNHGWRWITPTQSRIGTGYVFSSNHASDDEIVDELRKDIGNKKINPKFVNFNPRITKTCYRKNYCSIGMSQGFLEPLDAPGLSFTNGTILEIVDILQMKYENRDSQDFEKKLSDHLDWLNDFQKNQGYAWWCNFILTQYKTCHRQDTKFWIDHKNVKSNIYETLVEKIETTPHEIYEKVEMEMLYRTLAGKDVQWKSRTNEELFAIEENQTALIHHLDFIEKIKNYEILIFSD